MHLMYYLDEGGKRVYTLKVRFAKISFWSDDENIQSTFSNNASAAVRRDVLVS